MCSLKRLSISCFFVAILNVLLLQVAHSGQYIQTESEKKHIVASYIKKHTTSDFLTLDLLVNGTFSSDKASKLHGREMYFFYESQAYLEEYEQGKDSSLKKALISIDKAIAADSTSLNLFLKSYLLSLLGDNKNAEILFQNGIQKGIYSHYLARGSNAFVKLIKDTGITNEYNAFVFVCDITKLSINTKFIIYTLKKLRSSLRSPTITPKEKEAIYCGIINLVGDTSKAFYISQDNLVLAVTKLFKNLPAESRFDSCKLSFDPDVLKEINDPKDFKESYDKFKETGNIEYLRNSIFWRNFRTISRSLKTS